MFNFLKGDYEVGLKFVDAVEIFLHLVNIGNMRSPILRRTSMAHRQLIEKQQITAGPDPDLDAMRLSAGIKILDDIIADIDQALA